MVLPAHAAPVIVDYGNEVPPGACRPPGQAALTGLTRAEIILIRKPVKVFYFTVCTGLQGNVFIRPGQTQSV